MLSLVVPFGADGRIAAAQGHEIWQQIWRVYAYRVPEVPRKNYIITNNYNYSNTIKCWARKGAGFLAFGEVARDSSNPKCLRTPGLEHDY